MTGALLALAATVLSINGFLANPDINHTQGAAAMIGSCAIMAIAAIHSCHRHRRMVSGILAADRIHGGLPMNAQLWAVDADTRKRCTRFDKNGMLDVNHWNTRKRARHELPTNSWPSPYPNPGTDTGGPQR